MHRTDRIALVVVVLLTLVAVGGVAANVVPGGRTGSVNEIESEGVEAAPTTEELAHAAARLLANEIPFTDGQLSDLATRYGLGGAVRLLAWAHAEQMDVEAIAVKRDGTDTEPAMGWGQIAKELGQHPGIGSIMGNGHGREDAPGQQNKEPEE